MRVSVWGIFALLVWVMMAPPATAALLPSLRLEMSTTHVRVGPTSVLQTQNAVWRADLPPSTGVRDPVATFEPESVVATVYWRNVTIVLSPESGEPLHRRWSDLESRPLDFAPEQLYLLRPRDGPEVALLVNSPFPVVVQAGANAMFHTGHDDAPGVAPRALQHAFPFLNEFATKPSDAAWSEMDLRTVSGGEGVLLLVDGWDLRLSDGQRQVDLRTGYETTFQSPLLATESYQFVLLSIERGQVQLPQAGPFWQAWVRSPYASWSGPAYLHRVVGVVNDEKGGQHFKVDTLRLDGAFHAWFTFDEANGNVLRMRVAGQGATSLQPESVPTPTLPIPPAVGVGAPLLVGVAVLGTIGLRVVQGNHLARQAPRAPSSRPAGTSLLEASLDAGPVPAAAQAQPAPPSGLSDVAPTPAGAGAAAPPATIDAILAQVRENPLNGEARFHLGIALYRDNKPSEALRHLDRSFRLSPEALLKFLESPQYAEIRSRPEMRVLLQRFHREQHWKVWASYA